MRSYATATACSAPTSSTIAATSRWGTPGTIVTLLRAGVRKSGRIRRRAIPRPRRTSGGSGTTSQTRNPIDPEVGFDFGFVVEHKGNTYDHRCRITKVTRKRKSPIPGDTNDTKGTRWFRLNCFPNAKRTD